MDKSFRKRCIVFCFIALYAQAGNDEELFLRGNKLYEHHEYDKALSSYEMMAHKGRAVLYNMGNCYYHIHNYPQALVYWLRAERGATPYECGLIAHNKQQLAKKIGKHSTQSLVDRITSFVHAAMPYFSLLFLQIFFVILWCFFVFTTGKKNRFRKLISIVLLLLMMLLGAALGVYYLKHRTVFGVVVKQQAVLFSGPHAEFHAIGSVACADHVVVKEQREGWYKIGYSGNIGWVEAEAIQII
jgi:hypothetical protein